MTEDFMEIEPDSVRIENFRKLLKVLLKNMSKFIENPQNTNLLVLPQPNIEQLQWFMAKTLGKGGQGTVVDIFFENMVIKYSKCFDQYDETCTRLRNKTVYKTPYLNGTVVSLPDSVVENVIGYFLNKLSPFTPHFVLNYGMAWQNEQTYAITEKLKTDIFSSVKLKTGENLIITILQFLSALSIAQQIYQFTHNDCHVLNMLYEDCKEGFNKVHISSCKNPVETEHTSTVYYLKNPGWNLKINDYGLSRLEWNWNNSLYTGIMDNLRNFNKFSHCIDYLNLYACLFFPEFKQHPNQKLTEILTDMHRFIKVKLSELSKKLGFSKPRYMMYHYVCPSLVRKEASNLDNDTMIRNIYKIPSYRPDKNFITLNGDKFMTPDKIFSNMAEDLIRNGYTFITKNTPEIVVPNCVPNPIRNIENTSTLVIPERHKVLYSNVPFIREIPRNPMSLIEGITYRTVSGTYNKKEYNIADNITSCNSRQIIHIISIPKEAMGKLKFVSGCCGIDVSEFFHKKNRFGCAINGGFFDILKSNIPIGYYRDKNIKETIPVPDIYKDYYGLVGFSNDRAKDNLFMGFFSDYKNPDSINTDFVFLAGPVLIDKRKNWTFNSEMINKKIIYPESKEEIDVFKCIVPEGKFDQRKIINTPTKYMGCEGDRYVQKTSDRSYFNCNKIQPGELSHGSNLNPRTAIAYNSTSGILYFIVIEGRRSRGDGQDFVEMVNTLNKIDSNITVAINLDGGGSSNLAWRLPTNPDVIYNPNPEKTFPYPTGNILGIVTE